METNRPPQPNIVEREEYKPKYLQQIKLIQELTGSDENDILDTAKKDYMADWLLDFVCRFYDKKEQDILSDRKFRDLVLVRGIYSYLLKHRVPYSKQPYSLPKIGRKIGNRDHTTILGVLKKIDQYRREGNPKEGVTAEEFNNELETLWEKAVLEFEDFVRRENKQINQTVGEPLQNT
jgi:chromosomal replication initiation ATPase DnaA